MSAETRYLEALQSIPAPGCGCHAALLGVANLGVLTGRDEATIFTEIRNAIPVGNRIVGDREIRDAIHKSLKEIAPIDPRFSYRRPIPPPHRTPLEELADCLKDPAAAQKLQSRLIEAGGGEFDPFCADFWETSPIQIQPSRLSACLCAEEGILLLKNLYKPEDILYIGKTQASLREQSAHIKPAGEWIAFFEAAIEKLITLPKTVQQQRWQQFSREFPLIIPNPLTGRKAQTKTGENETLKGDNNVLSFRYLIAECDTLPLPRQGALLRGICRRFGYKICAIIFSGGKSLHAWLKVGEQVANQNDWTRKVAGVDFAILGRIGFDAACKNPSRASRFPGMFRVERDDYQRLLYLAPKGGSL